jgi:hypothetical protein
MARKVSARVVLNRSRLDEVRGALADGLQAMGADIVEHANPPDAEPFGVGLVTSGGTYVAVDGKKVGGDSSRPRAVRGEPGIVAVVGFGFPGRFQEFGTIHSPAQPFLSPAVDEVLPNLEQYLAPAIRARLGGR